MKNGVAVYGDMKLDKHDETMICWSVRLRSQPDWPSYNCRQIIHGKPSLC